MIWNVFDPLKPVPPRPTPGGGGDTSQISKDLYNHMNNNRVHVTPKLIEIVNSSITTKDVVFKLIGPLFKGVQEETEFVFPYKGKLENINISISIDSKPNSNVILSIQEYKGNNNWQNISTVNLQYGEKGANIKTNDIVLDNSRLRVALIDGDFENIKNMNLVLRLKKA